MCLQAKSGYWQPLVSSRLWSQRSGLLERMPSRSHTTAVSAMYMSSELHARGEQPILPLFLVQPGVPSCSDINNPKARH